MNTTFLLLSCFGKVAVPLSEICEEYFGCSIRTAASKAKAGTLPVPAFQASQSQKSPWLVNVADLAKLLDKHRSIAEADWHNKN
jgi:hypothetical protein